MVRETDVELIEDLIDKFDVGVNQTIATLLEVVQDGTDADFIEDLIDEFDLNPSRRISTLLDALADAGKEATAD